MKKSNCFRTFLVSILFAGLTLAARAWDNPGHMAVAGLAYDELTTNQQARLVALLQKHPALNLITRGFPNGTPDDRNLVMAAATWPDLAKSATNFTDNGYEADAPAVTQVTFDHLMHKGYHFIDQPIWVGTGPAPATLPAIPKVNAVGVINVLVTQLQSNESDAAKAYDLGWLLHLVGDLHQPLHAVTAVSEMYTNGDEGGNFVTITGDTQGEKELHAYWDDVLGKTTPSNKRTHAPRLDKDIATADTIITEVQPLPLPVNAENVDPAAWASESQALAKVDAYNITLQPATAGSGNRLEAALDDTYNQTAVQVAQKQIRLAGHRLALLLQQALQ